MILLQLRRFRFYTLPWFCYIFFLGVMAIILFGTIWQSDIETNLELNSGYLFLFLTFFFLYGDKRWLHVFLRLCCIFGAFYILTTIWLYYDSNSYFTYFAYHLYPDNPNYDFYSGYQSGFTAGVTDHYSTNGMMLVNAVVTFFSYAIVKKENKRISIPSAVFFALGVFAIVLTGKRAHLLFTVIACVIVLFLYLAKDKNRSVKYVALLLVLLVVGTILFNTSSKLQSVLARFINMTSDANVTTRFDYWRMAMDLFSGNELLGIGWLKFKDVSLQEQYVHNIYIQLLCETGIFGALLFYIFFIYAFWVSLKWFMLACRNKSQSSREMLVITVFSLGYQLYFLMYGLTGNPLYDYYGYPLYFLSALFTLSCYKGAVENKSKILEKRLSNRSISRGRSMTFDR